ncbi:MAG: exonuclease SbcCD subunit D [Chloroflexi bacterium]|nr:exonuclease SbcCD subunit D [Chloroflexota bacterium]
MQVRFVHFADVHLGFRQYGLAERAEDFTRAFGSVIAYCREVRPDFVILAGDLFDSKSIDPRTYADADAGLALLAHDGIPVVAVEGNHERWFRRGERSWLWQLSRSNRLRLLQQVDPEREGLKWRPWTAERGHGAYTDIGPVRIFGVEYLGARLADHLPRVIEAAQAAPADGVQFRVGVLHTGVDEESPGGQGGVGAADVLKLRGVADHLALGHIHYRYEVPVADPWIFNPGALEAHSVTEGLMGEPGLAGAGRERGLYDVTVEFGDRPRVDARFRDDVVERRPFVRLAIDVTGAESSAALRERVAVALDPPSATSGPRPMVEIVLRGELGFERAALDQAALLELVQEHFDPLHARVTLDVERTLGAGVRVGSGSREQIERDVVRELLAQEPAVAAQAETLAERTLELKRTVLEGQDEEALASIVEATLP